MLRLVSNFVTPGATYVAGTLAEDLPEAVLAEAQALGQLDDTDSDPAELTRRLQAIRALGPDEQVTALQELIDALSGEATGAEPDPPPADPDPPAPSGRRGRARPD